MAYTQVLICISQMTHDVEHSLCTYCLVVYIFGKMSTQILGSLFNWIICPCIVELQILFICSGY